MFWSEFGCRDPSKCVGLVLLNILVEFSGRKPILDPCPVPRAPPPPLTMRVLRSRWGYGPECTVSLACGNALLHEMSWPFPHPNSDLHTS
jgi:hypothetical protein